MNKPVKPIVKSAARELLFWVGVLFTVAAPIAMSVFGKSDSIVWVTALCGAFVTFVAKLDDLAELSLGPVKAKMRETIAAATATIDQLREVATTISSAMLTDMMAGNFMAGMTLERRLELYDTLMAELTAVGISKEQCQQASANWNKGIGIIYQRIVRGHIEEQATAKLPPEQRPKWRTEFDAMMDFKNWDAPRPSEMERFCRERDILTPEIQAWIDDYRHYQSTNEIRRRSEFASG